LGITRDAGDFLCIDRVQLGTHRFTFGLFRLLSPLLSQIEIAHHSKDVCAATKVGPFICDPRVIENFLQVRMG
jgi:hypothetical protein